MNPRDPSPKYIFGSRYTFEQNKGEVIDVTKSKIVPRRPKLGTVRYIDAQKIAIRKT